MSNKYLLESTFHSPEGIGFYPMSVNVVVLLQMDTSQKGGDTLELDGYLSALGLDMAPAESSASRVSPGLFLQILGAIMHCM